MHLQGAEPFLLPGGRHGVLLIHGFTGLPAELRLMGEYLNARGFTVLAIRLAGHGTTVEDLSRMEHEDWMDSVRDGYAILSGVCERISVVGHSMGAVFAILLSLEEDLAHVVSLGAPIMIAPEQGIEHLPTREACIDRYVPKARCEQPLSADAARLHPRDDGCHCDSLRTDRAGHGTNPDCARRARPHSRSEERGLSL